MSNDLPLNQSPLDKPPTSNTLDEFKKMYQHDAFCKNKLKEVKTAQKFLRFFLKPEIQALLDIDRLQIDSESLIDEHLKRSYIDVIYRVPLKESDGTLVVFILIELKTDNDQWAIFQVLLYIVRLWKREWQAAKKAGQLNTFLLPMIIPIIFHHGDCPFTAPDELIALVHTVAGLEPYTLNMKSFLLDVTALEQKDFPEDLELCVLFMVLQAVFSKDVADRLMAVYHKLRPTLHLKESQQEWYDALYYATTSAKYFEPQDFTNLIQQTEQEGVITMSTSLLDKLIAEREAKITEHFTEREAKSKAEIAEMIEREAKNKAEMIIRILSHRLELPSRTLQDEITSIRNLAKLDELVDFALTCISLDEFATALK
jgi:hypothetical protein